MSTDEDRGTLISEKITWGGFIAAMIDVGFMALCEAVMMSALIATKFYSDVFITVILSGVAVMFFGKFVNCFTRVTSPKNNYEMKRVFVKDGGETTELISYR